MIDPALLARLGALHGIEPEYHDIWGNLHRISEATCRGLLAAMGIDAGSDEAITAAISDAEAARWHAPLPPVVVARATRLPLTVTLRLPLPLRPDALGWRLREESGAEHGGEFRPEALPECERTTTHTAREFTVPHHPEPGYHELLLLHGADVLARCRFVVAPDRCYRPDALCEGRRVWGPAVQLYGVRSERNWGMGDFSDLRTLVEQWGARGAAIVGVNPLHALFTHNAEHASPYSPSSRLFLNALYLDLESVADYAECAEARALVESAAFQSRLQALRASELVDYAGVAAAKRDVAEILFAHFRRAHLAAATHRAGEFRLFQAQGGESLRRHALFEALQEAFHRDDPLVWGWPAWPAACRDPRSPEVRRFAAAHADRVEFYEYLQWQAELQLAAVGRRAFELGLGVGLYQDLAVSIDRGGAEAWANQSLYAIGASVGAPPDDFNLHGQDWGLPPMIPDRLAEAAYEPFIATLRENMRHCGALRIDHVMGLRRLFWVPPGGKADDGAYVRYPFADLLGIVALESHRNHCLVIGEDLGTVPDEVRAGLYEAGVLSYRLLYFERRHGGEPKPPAEYPADALVAASTHDLPTLAGFWAGRDIELRIALDLYPTDELRRAQIDGRSRDRVEFLAALARHGLLPEDMSTDPAATPAMTAEFARALHAWITRTPACVLVVQLEDVLGTIEQANLPGTTTGHPNWRRKLALALERWPDDERFRDLTATLRVERGSGCGSANLAA